MPQVWEVMLAQGNGGLWRDSFWVSLHSYALILPSQASLHIHWCGSQDSFSGNGVITVCNFFSHLFYETIH